MEILSGHRDSIDIGYQSSLSLPAANQDAPSHFQQLWQKMRPKEMHIGSTLVGPHRDDLEYPFEGKTGKSFSSEGQKRSCISSLRFAQWEQMAGALGYAPILGIDDFGIQLDKDRLSQLKTHLSKFKQVFLTSPVQMQEHFTENLPVRALTVKNGAVG